MSASAMKGGMLRNVAICGSVFFLLTVLLTVYVIFPKLDELFENVYKESNVLGLVSDGNYFTNHVEQYESSLLEVARTPGVIDAVRMSDAISSRYMGLKKGLQGDKEFYLFVMQNAEGEALFKSKREALGNYNVNSDWASQMLNGEKPYYYRLLKQDTRSFTFQLSVPIKNEFGIAGILSGEATTLFSHVFPFLEFDKHIGIKLVQEHMAVESDVSHFDVVDEYRETSLGAEVEIIYRSDRAVVVESQTSLKRTIIFVLLAGLVASFILIVIYCYQRLSGRLDIGHGKSPTWRVYLIPISVFFFGVASNIAGYLTIHSYQEQAIYDSQISRAKASVRDIKESLGRKVDVLASVSALFNASSTVSRAEFSAFVKPYILQHPGIKAIEWIPNVSHSQRRYMEKSAIDDGFTNFAFTEKGSDSVLIPSARKERYFPVYYIEPLEGNEQAFGFDLGSDENRLHALSKAAESGSEVATVPIRLVQDKETQTGILIFHPVHPFVLDQAGQRSVSGYVLLVLRINSMIQQFSRNDKISGSVAIYDISKSGGALEVFGVAPSGQEAIFSESIKVADRVWRVDVYPNSNNWTLSWLPKLVLSGGLGMVMLITIGLVYLVRRHEMVGTLVKQRTAELLMLSTIVENSNEMVIVTTANRQAVPKMSPKILYVNEAFSRFTGYSQEEVIGETLAFLSGGLTSKKQLQELRQKYDEGEVFEGELLQYKKNNDTYWVDVRVSPLKNKKGEIVQYSNVGRDITDQKKAAVEREKMIDELTDSNEELERFAFVCSHDLQEPLRMIRSFSEKLQNHIGDSLDDDEKGKKYFKFITNGAARAQNLIEDILSYSSISNDTKKSQLVSGQAIINGIKNTMQVSLMESGARITTNVLPMLQGNKTQLHQLFQNLINNGVKYQAPGTSPHVQISVQDAGDLWQFSVKDNGIGMEQKHLEKIFDVFQRLHRKSEYAGTGVGLSICKKVVSRHGGKIWVESEPGVGSTFHFTLQKPKAMEEKRNEQRKVG